MGWYRPRTEMIEALPINVGTSMYKLYNFIGPDWTFIQEKRVAGDGLYIALHNLLHGSDHRSVTLEIRPNHEYYLVKQDDMLFLLDAINFNNNYVRCSKNGH